jgi:hypothetical protein
VRATKASKYKVASRKGTGEAVSKQVPLQVMVSEPVRRQIAMMSVERGENLRTTVLRGLKAIGVRVPDGELIDRRGRRPKEQ